LHFLGHFGGDQLGMEGHEFLAIAETGLAYSKNPEAVVE